MHRISDEIEERAEILREGPGTYRDNRFLHCAGEGGRQDDGQLDAIHPLRVPPLCLHCA